LLFLKENFSISIPCGAAVIICFSKYHNRHFRGRTKVFLRNKCEWMLCKLTSNVIYINCSMYFFSWKLFIKRLAIQEVVAVDVIEKLIHIFFVSCSNSPSQKDI
jgi:hypothetical protein